MSCCEKWPVDTVVMERKVMLQARRPLPALSFLRHCTWTSRWVKALWWMHVVLVLHCVKQFFFVKVGVNLK